MRPSVAQRDLVAGDEEIVVTHDVCIGGAARVSEFSVELDPHSEALIPAVGTDPALADQFPFLAYGGWQSMGAFDTSAVFEFEVGLDPWSVTSRSRRAKVRFLTWR